MYFYFGLEFCIQNCRFVRCTLNNLFFFLILFVGRIQWKTPKIFLRPFLFLFCIFFIFGRKSGFPKWNMYTLWPAPKIGFIFVCSSSPFLVKIRKIFIKIMMVQRVLLLFFFQLKKQWWFLFFSCKIPKRFKTQNFSS